MRPTTCLHRALDSEVRALARARRQAEVASPDDSVLLAAPAPEWADGQTTVGADPTRGAAVMLDERADNLVQARLPLDARRLVDVGLDQAWQDRSAPGIKGSRPRAGRCLTGGAGMGDDAVGDDHGGIRNGGRAGAVDELAVGDECGSWLELHGGGRLPAWPIQG